MDTHAKRRRDRRATFFVPGARAKVRVVPLPDGTLLAHRISLKVTEGLPHAAALEGRLEHANPSTRSVQLLGREFQLAPDASVLNAGKEPMAFSALGAHPAVKLKGTFRAEGFLCQQIRPAPQRAYTEIKGQIQQIDFDRRTLQMLGITVVWNRKTSFRAGDGLWENHLGFENFQPAPVEDSGRLCHYLQLPQRPIKQCKAMCEVQISPAQQGDPAGGQPLIDQVNRRVLRALAACDHIPKGAFLLGFAGGSAVENRLSQAHGRWAHIHALFQLDPIWQSLKHIYGGQDVEALVASLNRLVLSDLLFEGRKLGPAKLLFRVRRPNDAAKLFAPSNYPELEAFVEQASQLAGRASGWVSSPDPRSNAQGTLINDVLDGMRLGDAYWRVKRKFEALIERFALGDALDVTTNAAFDRFVEALTQTRGMHPMRPVPDGTVSTIAKQYATTTLVAKKLVVLFRLAWLTPFEKPQYFSDLMIRSLVVVPQPLSDGIDTIRKSAQLQLTHSFGALEGALQGCDWLKRICERHPQLRLKSRALVFSLPEPLFELFVSLKDGADRFAILLQHRLGKAFIAQYLQELTAHPAHRHALARIESKFNLSLLHELDAMRARILSLKAYKTPLDILKQQQTQSLELSPATVRSWLEDAIQNPSPEKLNACAQQFIEMAKYDFGAVMRGQWHIKT